LWQVQGWLQNCKLAVTFCVEARYAVFQELTGVVGRRLAV
jgi:hypothetical protein